MSTVFLCFFRNFSPSTKTVSSLIMRMIDLINSIKKLAEKVQEAPFVLTSQKRINNFLNLEERNDKQKEVIIKEPIKTISIKNISFTFPHGNQIFNKFNLNFSSGKINRISEKNGFGKSTLINIILGLLFIQEEQIVINENFLLQNLNLSEWRKKIVYIEYDNLVDEKLSTGQKQQKEIENSLKNWEEKDIFIFDEADNSLDEEKKTRFLKKNWRNWKKNSYFN